MPEPCGERTGFGGLSGPLRVVLLSVLAGDDGLMGADTSV